MKPLILVGCSKAKLPRTAPARELYCSTLFKLSRDYAERHAVSWAVLSGYHGVVFPETPLAPYNVSVRDRLTFPTNIRLNKRSYERWLVAQVQVWYSRFALFFGGPPLVVLAGQHYAEPIARSGLFGQVAMPLARLSTGQRLKMMKFLLS